MHKLKTEPMSIDIFRYFFIFNSAWFTFYAMAYNYARGPSGVVRGKLMISSLDHCCLVNIGFRLCFWQGNGLDVEKSSFMMASLNLTKKFIEETHLVIEQRLRYGVTMH